MMYITIFFNKKKSDNDAWSFEALVVAMADEISQRHHDIEDGLIAKVIEKDVVIDLIKDYLSPYFNLNEKNIFNKLSNLEADNFNQNVSRLVVGCLNRNLIINSRENLRSICKELGIKRRGDFEALYPRLSESSIIYCRNKEIKIRDVISHPDGLSKDEKIFKQRLGMSVLNSYQVQRMDGKSRYVIRKLIKAYLTNPQQLPDSWINRIISLCHPEREDTRSMPIGEKRAWVNNVYLSSHNTIIKKDLLRLICDFIAGMTDDFALMEHGRLYSTSEILNLRHY